MLILLANEPRAYREGIAEVFRQLLPNVEVITAEPEELQARILGHAPKMGRSRRYSFATCSPTWSV